MTEKAQQCKGFFNNDRARVWILALVLIAQLAVYLPYVGRGFVTDDFIWLRESLHNGRIDLSRSFTTTTGFFRPLVGLSFGLQFLFHGTTPRAYGLFNLLLHLLNIILAFLLLRSWERTRPLAVWGAVLFALNLKAAGMAVGWISGRSELLFSFFLLLAFWSCLNIKREAPALLKTARYLLCAVFYLAALLSKETAAAAPLFVFLFTFLNLKSGSHPESILPKFFRGLRAALPFLITLMIYFMLRFQSDAFTPFNAPAYYRFRFSPITLLKNIWEYLTRSAVLDILILIFFLGFYLFKRNRVERRSTSADRAVIATGLFWFFCFLLPCLFLEARSDLYAYFPQLGLHLVCLAWLAGYPRFSEAYPQDQGSARSLLWGLFLLLLCWSAFLGYQARSRSLQAQASSLFCRRLAGAVQRIPAGKKLLVVDTHFGERTAPSSAVGYGLDAMLQLVAPGKDLRGEFITLETARNLFGRDLKNSVAFIWQNGEVRRVKRGRQKKTGKPIGLIV
jgi:hypothetical protein